jgi:alpha-methylacyl-CoA racemase
VVAVFRQSDACVAPVLSLEEAAQHPHLRDRGDFYGDEASICPAAAPRFSAYPNPPPEAPSPENAQAAEIVREWTAQSRPDGCDPSLADPLHPAGRDGSPAGPVPASGGETPGRSPAEEWQA